MGGFLVVATKRVVLAGAPPDADDAGAELLPRRGLDVASAHPARLGTLHPVSERLDAYRMKKLERTEAAPRRLPSH
jgi:hypothetical protein